MKRRISDFLEEYANNCNNTLKSEWPHAHDRAVAGHWDTASIRRAVAQDLGTGGTVIRW